MERFLLSMIIFVAEPNANKTTRHQSALLPQNATHPQLQYNTSLIAIKCETHSLQTSNNMYDD